MRLLFALSAALLTAIATAQSAYPERPVRLVTGFPPGGAPDLTARVLAQALGEAWGKPVIVESLTGASGSVAAGHVAKAPADGYTLLLSGDAAMTTNVALFEKLAYDPLKDFSPITLATVAANILVVHPSVPANHIGELISLAKAQPGRISFASAGSGTSQHLAGELLKSMAGVDIVHVPYKGPAAIQDVLSGRVAMMFANVVFALPHVRQGKLRALAVSSLKRHPAVPDLPTVSESGLSGFEAVAWFGLLAPSGTPDPVIGKVYQDTVRALASPAVRAKLTGAGLEVIGSSPQEFATQIRTEIGSKGALVRASGAKPG